MSFRGARRTRSGARIIDDRPMMGAGAQKRSASMAGWGGGGWRPASKYTRSGARIISSRRSLVAAMQKNSGELKGMDTVLTQAASIVASTGDNSNALALNLVETGAGSYNRIGRKIFCKTLRLKGMAIYYSQTAATTYDVGRSALRMVVVWDKQPSGVLPAWDVIFGHTTQDGTEASTTMGNLKFDNTGRFQVLKDCLFYPPPVMPSDGAAAANVSSAVCFDEFIDLKNRTTIFSGDSDPTTIADISSGGLYVYWRAIDAVTASENAWGIDDTSTARLRFTS